MRLRTLLSPLFFTVFGVACNGAGAEGKPAVAPSLSAAHPSPAPAATGPDAAGNELAMTTLHTLAADPGNVFFSSTSLRDALGMTALGAQGQTLAEMATALHLDPDADTNAAHARAEADAWKRATGSAELVIANRLWLANAFTIDPTFAKRTQDGYDASAVRVDFLHQPDPSRVQINDWVKATTKGKIPELLPAGSIDGGTRLVLTNAVYFKGSWVSAFSKDATRPQTFHANGGDVQTPMMHQLAVAGVADTDAAMIVDLPYKDSNLSMLVVLPKNGGLHGLETTLTASQLGAWTGALKNDQISLAMPKFSFSWGGSVKQPLEEMGIHRLFTAQAELSNVSSASGDPIFVSDVVHKAFVHVDETGTEAAAATGVVVKSHAMARHREVTLDSPFLFFVRDRTTGNILFSGRLAHPT